MEYEIDLRKYAVAILRRWRLIVLAAIVSAGIALGLSLVLPKTYTATASALIFIRQTGSQLGTNEPLLNIETIDVGSRRQGLVALASSETIEAQLPPHVVQQATPPNYRPGMLVRSGLIEVGLNGDLINITAKGSTPSQAKTLVDAWMNTYIAVVDQFYTDEHSTVRLAGEAIAPYQAASPRIGINTITAGIAGVILGTIMVLLLELMGLDRSVKSKTPVQSKSAGSPSLTR